MHSKSERYSETLVFSYMLAASLPLSILFITLTLSFLTFSLSLSLVLGLRG